MDVVSHALFGRLLGRFDAAGALGPGARAAFVLGALAPDADAVVMPFGWDRYLLVHESWLHTLLATPVVALAVALVVRASVKRSQLVLLWWAALGSVLAGHVLFDLVSGSDMRILMPFDPIRLGPHWLAMADVSAILILLLCTLWSRWHPRMAALGTVAMLTLLVAFKAGSQRQAIAFFSGSPQESGRTTVSVEAVNGSLFEWRFYEASASAVRAWRVDPWSAQRALDFERSVDAEAVTLSATVQVPVIDNLRRLARVPFPRIETDRGRRFLLWSDARFCDETTCDLSFGAEIDSEGRPIDQFVRIGPIEQRRSLPATFAPR